MLLLGLEILVAADLITTVAVAPTLRNVAVLGLIVLIRTFLSVSLQVEIDGRVPWRRAREDAGALATGDSCVTIAVRPLRLLELVPTTSWTIVMTCGVVSVDLAADHQDVLSAVLFWFAAAVWILLMGVLAGPLLFQDGRLGREAASPAVLTIVAATAVHRHAHRDGRPPHGDGRAAGAGRDRVGGVDRAGAAPVENADSRRLVHHRRGG